MQLFSISWCKLFAKYEEKEDKGSYHPWISAVGFAYHFRTLMHCARTWLAPRGGRLNLLRPEPPETHECGQLRHRIWEVGNVSRFCWRHVSCSFLGCNSINFTRFLHNINIYVTIFIVLKSHLTLHILYKIYLFHL